MWSDRAISVNVAALLARAVFADKTRFIGEYGAGKQRRYIHASCDWKMKSPWWSATRTLTTHP